MAPVYFDTRLVKLVPKDLRGMACGQCDKAQSIWLRTRHASEENPYVCSWCLVYRSSWGDLERKNWDIFVEAVEDSRQLSFEKDEEKCLKSCKDIDGLMAAVYMENQVQRVAAAKKAKG